MRSLIRKLHRQLGLLFSLTILMSSGSGLVHILMTRTQEAPPPTRPTSAALDLSSITVTPAQAFPEATPSAINIRNIAGKPHYQAFNPTKNSFSYIDATTGLETPDADITYAREIAANFLGVNDLKHTAFLTKFDKEYVAIFRILPVHRFDLNDGKQPRVYVSTMTGSVTRHTDQSKQLEASVFSNFHKLTFIPNKNARDITLFIITAAAFIISILGIALFFLTKPKKRTSK